MFLFGVLLANFLISGICFPFLELPQGSLKGRYLKTLNKRTFSSFTGIPYAEPPIGDLRFESPRPVKKWNGTLNANKLLHPFCLQGGQSIAFGSENCLYLNVYTPQLNFSTVSKLLPVMIYIHGGAFLMGSANRLQYNPSSILDKDVVLVVPNYRLGALGFLSTGDEVIPGNNGLKDQSLAIKWAKENIKYFGGNPDKITVWGQSSGGTCAHLHMLSPLSRHLINGVISQSGTAYWRTTLNDENVKNGKKLALTLNCTISSNREMVKCLKKAKATEITKKQHSFYKWEVDPMVPFKPVIEANHPDAFLTESPAEIIKSGKAAKVPFMTGITTEDGALRSPTFFVKEHLLQELNEDFKRIAPIVFAYNGIEFDKDYVSRRIKEFYFDNKTISNFSRSELTAAFTDASFLAGATNSLWLHLNYTDQPIYFYAFGHRSNFSFSSTIDNSFNYGVSHNDDLLYLFSFEGAIPGYKPSTIDRNVKNIMINLWTNFVAFGNPNSPLPSQSVLGEEWKPVKSANLEYYFIDDDAHMDKKLYWNRTQFLNRLPF